MHDEVGIAADLLAFKQAFKKGYTAGFKEPMNWKQRFA